MLNTFPNINCSYVTTLSILVIVKFSVTATCFLISLWPRNWAFPWTWLSKFRSHNC